MWRSVGFLMSLAVVLEGMTIITYVVILAGGMQKRASGWKILSALLLLVGAVQCTSMAIMVRGQPFSNLHGIAYDSAPIGQQADHYFRRPISTMKMIVSFPAGDSMTHGFSALSAGVYWS